MSRPPFELEKKISQEKIDTGENATTKYQKNKNLHLDEEIQKSREAFHKIVRAGAGAGKTTNLIKEVFNWSRQFHSEKGRWPKLILTTFTRKATQEIKERLLEEALRQNDFEIIQYLNSPSHIQISTLHGVFGLFLRRYGHLVEIDSNYKVIASHEAKVMGKKLLKNILQGEEGRAVGKILLKDYSFQQLFEKLYEFSQIFLQYPNLKIVNASGLQHILQDQWHRLLKELKVSSKCIFQTAQENSWKEFSGRIFSFCSECLKKDRLTQEEVGQFVSSLGRKPPYREKTSFSSELHQSLEEGLKKIKLTLEKPSWNEAYFPQMEIIYKNFFELGKIFSLAFENQKKELGFLEMSDMENFTFKILREEPRLGKNFSEEWDYWLIDEYQDTSPLQVDILNFLCGASPVYRVGDPQQSIYLFRGAREEVFQEAELQVPLEGRELLKINYRTCPELLEFFNDIFLGLSKKFIAMEPKNNIFNKDLVVASLLEIDGDLDDVFLEPKVIAEKVLDLISQGVPLGEICILARKNKTLKNVAIILSQQGIPIQLHSSSGFFQKREIIDAMSLLKFLANPHDNENLILLLRGPWVHISDTELANTIAASSPQKDLKSESVRPKSYWLQFESWEHESLTLLRKFQELAFNFGIIYAFEEALISLGMIDLAHKYDPTGRRESNLWKFMAHLRELEKSRNLKLFDFLKNTSSYLQSEEGAEEGEASASLEPNCVNLMTIHASKGLEFEHVILCACGDPPEKPRPRALYLNEEKQILSFPVYFEPEDKNFLSLHCEKVRDDMKDREFAEYDRLFYVALTRSKKTVTLTWKSPSHVDSWIQRIDFIKNQKKSEKYSLQFEKKSQVNDLQKFVNVQSSVKGSVQFSEKWISHKEKKYQKISVTKKLEKDFVNESTENKLSGWDFRGSDFNEVFNKAVHSPVYSYDHLQKRIEKVTQGVFLHSLFEKVKYKSSLSGGGVKREEIFNDEDLQDNPLLREAFEYVLNLEDPPVLQILSKGFVEWGYQMLDANQNIIEGQIDLWGEDEQGRCWVLDYKSGSSQHKEKAFAQLKIYAEALVKLDFQNIYLCVIYPLEKSCFVREYEV